MAIVTAAISDVMCATTCADGFSSENIRGFICLNKLHFIEIDWVLLLSMNLLSVPVESCPVYLSANKCDWSHHSVCISRRYSSIFHYFIKLPNTLAPVNIIKQHTHTHSYHRIRCDSMTCSYCQTRNAGEKNANKYTKHTATQSCIESVWQLHISRKLIFCKHSTVRIMYIHEVYCGNY